MNSTIVKVLGIVVIVGTSMYGLNHLWNKQVFLYEVEKKVLGDDVYFEITDKTITPAPVVSAQPQPARSSSFFYKFSKKQEDAENIVVTKEVTFKAKSDNTSNWDDNKHHWECKVKLDKNTEQFFKDLNKVKEQLPTSAADSKNKLKQKSKSVLVFWCSWKKEEGLHNNDSVVASFYWPDDTSVESFLSRNITERLFF